MLAWVHNFVARIRRRPVLAAGALLPMLAGVVWAGDQGLTWRHWFLSQRATGARALDDAQRHIRVCLDAWPHDPAVHVLASRIARLQRQPDEAFRRLDEAKRLGGDAERILLEKYLLRAERGEVRDVEKKLLAFVAKDDRDAIFILDVLTYQWTVTHRFAEALARVHDWVQRQPGQREPLIRRAWIEERLRDYPAALADYQQALDLDPHEDQRQGDRVRLLLAELLQERHQPKEALVHFETLVERQPHHVAARFGLARCLLVLGQTDAGVKVLTDLVAEHPKHGKALAELGRVQFETEKLSKAEISLRQAFALQPRDKQTVFSMYQCLFKLGKKDEARELAERLDQIRADEKDMAALMIDVQRAPEDPALRQQIGEIFLRNGLVEEGLPWLRSALQYDPAYTAALEVLAEWWESRGEMEKAAPHREMLARQGVAKKANRFVEQK